MKATLSHDQAKSTSGSPPEKAAPEKAPDSPDVNPVWHRLATYTASRARSAGQPDPPPVRRSSATTPVVRRLCAECEDEMATETPRVQTKLTVGAPDDEYEREADAVAERVMRMPVEDLPIEQEEEEETAPNAFLQRMCAACEETLQCVPLAVGQEDDDRVLSTKPDGDHSTGDVSHTTAKYINGLRGGGSPLPAGALAFFEPRFGADFSRVRVHTGSQAADAARGVNARAFTFGNDIVFGRGEYGPDSSNGRHLLAHELTHTIQQNGSRPKPLKRKRIQRQTGPADAEARPTGATAPVQQIHRASQRGADGLVQRGALEVLESAGAAVREAGESAVETAGEVGEAVVEAGEQIGEAVVETAGEIGEAAVEGVTWLATTAGRAALSAANGLAAQLGGRVTVGRAGLVITIPSVNFCPTMTQTFALPGASKYVPLIAGGFSVGAVSVIGNAGLDFSYKPSLTAVLGPCRLSGVRVELNPITGRYLGTGTISVGAALSQLNLARGGLRGQVDVIVIVPIDGVPIPVKIPVAAIEGGGQLSLRLSGGGTLSSSVSLLYTSGSLSFTANPTLALGGAIDLDLAAFARLEALGVNLCDFVWPLWHWGASVGHQWSLPLALSYGGGGAGLSVGPIDSVPVPFEDAVTGIDRTPPSTDCKIVDQICFLMRALGLLPSQRGVVWTGHPPPAVLTPCNVHPDAPHVEDPLIPSGAKCRGVCGPDCAPNCTAEPDRNRCAEDLGGNRHFICIYKGVQTCGTHEGCRNHDACYDWCAAGGSGSIFDSCHRWCDFGCICDYDLNRCIGWALGMPPFDSEMTFYDESISLMHGPFPGACPEGQVVADRVYQYLALGDPVAIVTALAEAPLEERMHLAADPLAIELLEAAIGSVLWPVARRIIDGAASVAVPSLDEATRFLADQAIQNGDHARALRVVLDGLAARGLINNTLADWSHVGRVDRGEGLTIFRLVEDPITHERRARAPVRVEVYTPAFTDVGWLFSTVQHEYLHVLQVLAGYEAAEFDVSGNQRPEFVARDEVESYLWEIEHAVGSGLINNVAQMRDVGRRLTEEFNAMTRALQAQYRVRYDAARQRVRDVVSGRPHLSIDEARRIVQESSRQIAELLKERPGNESAIDARIEAIRRRRSLAMIEVALVENPAIQVVQPGDPGTYRVPTVDADGRVRYLYGGIQVAWHMGPTSTSAHTLGEALGAGGQMAVAGTAVQGRVHPFPPDIDFDEHIHVVADTVEEAGRLAAGRIISNIRRISGGPVPGRTDLEFRHLLTFPRGGGSGIRMSLGQLLRADATTRLGRAIAQLNGGNMNTFWRGMLADQRFTDITRVVFISAERRDGSELIGLTGSADFNLAFLEDPGSVSATSLGHFAWQMCCDAMRRARAGKWLKAGKRAYNYFSTIGDSEHMAALEPVFRRPETMIEQYATVIDGMQHVLATRDMGVRQPRTRILTVDEARRQVERVANEVENHLPDSGVGSNPAAIARDLRVLSGYLRPRNARGHLMHDDALARDFGREANAIREHIDAGVRGVVEPIVRGIVGPVCPDEAACRRRR